VETSATVFAETESGIPLVFRATAATATVEEGPYIKITGSLGGVTLGGAAPAKLVTVGKTAFEEAEVPGCGSSFDDQMAAFLASAERGAPVMSTAEEALALMRFYDAVYRSAEEGREILL
jgi:predicted dehydrogenase